MTGKLAAAAEILKQALARRDPLVLDSPRARPAAVLAPLWEDRGRVRVVFTKRTADLPTHAGQISFPGGARDPDDPDLEITALRETCEEIGVCDGRIEVLARLDQVVTITNYLVTPFVGVLAPGTEFNLNPLEVERLVTPPLAKVLDPDAYRPTDIEWQGVVFSQDALRYKDDVIWGATARILRNFIQALGPAAAEAARAAG